MSLRVRFSIDLQIFFLEILHQIETMICRCFSITFATDRDISDRTRCFEYSEIPKNTIFQRFGNLVVPKNLGFPKNQKKTKNNIFQNSFCRSPKCKDLWIFFLFFGFFCFLETPGFLEPPNSQTSGNFAPDRDISDMTRCFEYS